jgi:hypothetical protein
MTAARGRTNGSGGSGGVPTTARGALLVGVAVILGVVGLQVLDDSGTNPTPTVEANTTTSAGTGAGTSTTLGVARDPSQVRVKVYNASGVKGQAQATSDKLKGLGWVTVAPADYGSTRVGTAVQCVAGFEREAAALAADGLGKGAVVEAYPSTPPDGATEADCLVIEGKTA